MRFFSYTFAKLKNLICGRTAGGSLALLQRQKKTTTLLLVRHGQSEANLQGIYAGHTNSALSALGVRQAEATAEYIAKTYRVDRVYASDLARARDTAKAVADKLGLPVVCDRDLREINAGAWEGVSFDRLISDGDAAYQVWLTDIGAAACPGGETVAELQKRVIAAVRRIAAENPGKTVVIGTHATPIRVLQCHCSGKPLSYMQSIPWVSNASVTVAECKDGCITLKNIGCDHHLEGMQSELPAKV